LGWQGSYYLKPGCGLKNKKGAGFCGQTKANMRQGRRGGQLSKRKEKPQYNNSIIESVWVAGGKKSGGPYGGRSPKPSAKKGRKKLSRTTSRTRGRETWKERRRVVGEGSSAPWSSPWGGIPLSRVGQKGQRRRLREENPAKKSPPALQTEKKTPKKRGVKARRASVGATTPR